jgi:Zn-dependent membrane protease YugP
MRDAGGRDTVNKANFNGALTDHPDLSQPQMKIRNLSERAVPSTSLVLTTYAGHR